jgi:Chalcone isomerase-like
MTSPVQKPGRLPHFAPQAILRAARTLSLALALSLALQPALAQGGPAANGAAVIAGPEDIRTELKELLPHNRLVGRGRLTYFGFQVYDARLWAAPGFRAEDLSSQPFALELAYLRDFASADVAARSILEMRRSADISESQAKAWTQEMLRVIPDVKKGDRIMGANKPGIGAAFLVNGKPGGEIRDVEFARLFFGIWLSPKTSEPKLRSALLAGAM